MKICGHCSEQQPAAEFGWRTDRGHSHTICFSCRRAYWRKYHHKDRATYNRRRRARIAEYRARNRKYIREHLAQHPSVDCGVDEFTLLEFDHVRGTKLSDISPLVPCGAKSSVLIEEVKKRAVRCANCHRRRTALELWTPKQENAGTRNTE